MNWSNLYKSVFNILRIENNQAKVAGTGFVLNNKPIYILTCYHVVSEGTENNDGAIKYSITKRSGESLEKFDLRRGQISFLRAKKIICKPELDLAILEIDPSENEDVAEKLNLHRIKPLRSSFRSRARQIGSPVQWLSAGVLGDKTLTPRFFKGNIITGYITNQKYKFKNQQGESQEQVMEGIQLLEIDQLFVPGCSGGPVISSKNGKAIGYVHGFKSWPLMTNTIIKYDAEITEEDDNQSVNVNIKSKTPLVTSFSLAIDLRSIGKYLVDEKFLKNNFF